MEYDYNGNLTYEERIAKVSKEITNYYSFISKSESILVASLEHPIDDKIDDLFKFRRLYNILTIRRDNNTFDIVLNDMLKLDKKNGIIKLLEYKKNNIVFPNIKEITG